MVMKDAAETSMQALIWKCNSESQKSKLQMCPGILLGSQDSNPWAEKMEAEVPNTQKKTTKNSTLNPGLPQTNPSI